MKNYLFTVLLLFVLSPFSARAQSTERLPPPVPESVFPIGGLAFGIDDVSAPFMNDLKFNTIFNINGGAVKNYPEGFRGYVDMDGPLSPLVGGKVNSVATDTRFFLATNGYDPYAYDLIRSWRTVAGHAENGEWKVSFKEVAKWLRYS